MAVWAISAWSLTVPQQHRLMSFAPDAPMVAVGLNTAAVFLGIGVSGAVGAAGLTMLRSDQLGFLGGAIVVVALGVAIRQRLLALDHNRSKQSGRWANPEFGDVPESSCRGSSGVKSSGGRK